MALSLEALSDQSTIASTRLDTEKASDQATVHIRLLRILPTSTVQEVQCEIRSATTAEQYVCLSYCWGNIAACFITLNGLPAKVRPNLYEFLREATRRGIQDWLWIDALCINQSNVAERNHQVKRMASIYRSAQQVIIWLGAYPPYFDQTFPVSSDNRRAFFDSLMTLSQDMVPTNSETGVSGITGRRDEATPDFLLCLRAVCGKSYFDRVWIIQEFLLARTSEFWWGVDIFPTVGLQRAVQETQNNPPSNLTAETLDRVSRLTRFAVQFNSSGHRPRLIDNILSIKPSSCTDKRDRVYALLSLASDGHKFAVRYTDGLSDLYVRLCRFYSFSSADADQALSLAALLEVDTVLLIRDLFEDVPTNSSLTGHSYSRSAEISQPLGVASRKITYGVWMLHSRGQCREHWPTELGMPPGVRRVDQAQCIKDPRFDDPDERSPGGNALCTICAQLCSSKSPRPQKLTRFGSSDIWLNFSTYPDCIDPWERIVGLHLTNVDPSERDTQQEPIRVALQGFPSAKLNLQWLLIECGEDGNVFHQSTISVALHSFCSSHACPLSKDAWESSPWGVPFEDDGSVRSLFDDL